MSSALSSRPAASSHTLLSVPQFTPEFVTLSSVPGTYYAYLWHNVVIAVWLGPMTVESIPVIEQGCRVRGETHPEGVSTIHILVPGGSGLPTSEARSELGRIAREYGPQSPMNGVVIPGGGFWASAMRGVVTALSLLSPRNKLRMFATLRELASWLPPLHEQHTGTAVDPAELLSALEQAYALTCARG
jgi:hypothetical protein